MIILRSLAGLAAILALGSASLAATPGPRTSPPSRTEASRTCTIGSFKGVRLPGSTVCVRVSGFVRYETGTTFSRHGVDRP